MALAQASDLSAAKELQLHFFGGLWSPNLLENGPPFYLEKLLLQNQMLFIQLE